MTNDELMGLAIQEAITAKNAGEVPIGAVIEIDGRIVASLSLIHISEPTRPY